MKKPTPYRNSADLRQFSSQVGAHPNSSNLVPAGKYPVKGGIFEIFDQAISDTQAAELVPMHA
ncbi:MAG TPA: hypothetical protein ACFCUC_01815 [Desulfobacterales bacterium]